MSTSYDNTGLSRFGIHGSPYPAMTFSTVPRPVLSGSFDEWDVPLKLNLVRILNHTQSSLSSDLIPWEVYLVPCI